MLVLRLSFFLSLFFVIIGCEKSFDPIGEVNPIDINIVADGFGDHDGITSESEIEFISEYFTNHQQAWAIGSIAANYRDENVKSIPADTVIKTLSYTALIGPYTSESDLRDELSGLSIKTPFVGIYVLTRNGQCCIIKFFRAPGPRISDQIWDELQIIK